MLQLLLVPLLLLPVEFGRANDWITMGEDCRLIAAGDVDGDGCADVVTVNGNRDLCLAASVHGWKSAPWAVLASAVPEGEEALACGDFVPEAPGDEVAVIYPDHVDVRFDYRDGRLLGVRLLDEGASGEPFARTQPPLSPALPPPAYEPEALVLDSCLGDVSGDGAADTLTLYTCTRPYPHRVVRVAPGLAAGAADGDGDGLADVEEAEFGTDPRDRDSDGDGLLDGWEVKGLPRGVPLGERIGLFQSGAPDADARLSPLRQDVIVLVSPFEGVDPAALAAEIPAIRQLYAELHAVNPDGSSGVAVHFRIDPCAIPKADHTRFWGDLGNERLAPRERGLLHWMQVTPWGGGQSSETGDMGGAGFAHDVFAHEFGHQLSLSHTGDSAPAWCPLYTSLMSYAFSYGFDGDHAAIHFSDGRFRDTALEERALVERLPYPYEQVRYLANAPFRFPLEDAGDGTTKIDWNHDGWFAEGTVEADVNYGGSTYCGIRREHEAIGSAPCLAYVGDACLLLAADRTRDHLWLKTYLGDEKWSEKRALPNSGTERDPVLVGGRDFGLVFHHHLYGWRVTRCDAGSLGEPVPISDLPALELNACRVGERVLLVSRGDTNELEARWLTFAAGDCSKPAVSAPILLETRSLVVPGLCVDPTDGRVVLVTSMNNSRGVPFCMRVTWINVAGDGLWEQETLWTRGEASGNGCCSRPVVAFNPAGQLNIFHQGGPDATGQMIAYRTSRVGNKALDEGWLTCMLYDVWTRSRVPVGFASGPQGAIFAYRWDAGGEHINWLATAHDGFGIDREPMRDFDDGEKISKWGIRHSILTMRKE
ncbi:MAG: hypothetical protein HY812_06145 [Planctomycetes bacterium]|nr:hypothetical protein [Planctomycetota bacterium]